MPPPGSVTVQVLNGGGANGTATTGTTALAKLGFRTTAPGDTDTTSTTMVEYPPGMDSQAKAVAAHVPGAVPVATASVHEVTVVLGTDGHTVSPYQDASNAPAKSAAPARSAAPAPTGSAARAFDQSSCINCRPAPFKNCDRMALQVIHTIAILILAVIVVLAVNRSGRR